MLLGQRNERPHRVEVNFGNAMVWRRERAVRAANAYQVQRMRRRCSWDTEGVVRRRPRIRLSGAVLSAGLQSAVLDYLACDIGNGAPEIGRLCCEFLEGSFGAERELCDQKPGGLSHHIVLPCRFRPRLLHSLTIGQG